MLKEILVHVVMVALRMVAGDAHVFIHVECLYILERKFTLLVEFYQLLVHS